MDYVYLISQLITEDPDIILEELDLEHLEKFLTNHPIETIKAIQAYFQGVEDGLRRFGVSNKKIKKLKSRSILNKLIEYNKENTSHILDAIKQVVKPEYQSLIKQTDEGQHLIDIHKGKLLKILGKKANPTELEDKATALISLTQAQQEKFYTKLKQFKRSGNDFKVILRNPSIIKIDQWIPSGNTNASNMTEGKPEEYHKYFGDKKFYRMWCVQYKSHFDEYINDSPFYLMRVAVSIGSHSKNDEFLIHASPPSHGGGIKNMKDQDLDAIPGEQGDEIRAYFRGLLPHVIGTGEGKLITAFAYYFLDDILAQDLHKFVDKLWLASTPQAEKYTDWLLQSDPNMSQDKTMKIIEVLSRNGNVDARLRQELADKAIQYDKYLAKQQYEMDEERWEEDAVGMAAEVGNRWAENALFDDVYDDGEEEEDDEWEE